MAYNLPLNTTQGKEDPELHILEQFIIYKHCKTDENKNLHYRLILYYMTNINPP